MKLLILLVLVAAEIFGSEINPLSDEFVNYINSKQSSWKAGRNFDENVPIQHLRRLGSTRNQPNTKILRKVFDNDDSDIPESFDAREHFPKCKDVISRIADQSHCGSCWAVSSTTVMTDRRCIHSNGKFKDEISAIDLISCSHENSGCNGGQPDSAFYYWFTDGLVTGGPYNSSQGCKPYPFEHCDHYMTGSKNPCPPYSDTPDCVKECDDTSLTYKDELTFGTDDILWLQNETAIQKDLLANGPVVAAFTVYEDFLNYKSGVYQYTTGNYVFGHAVRVIGWGVEDNKPYWLVANSWNEYWGDHGYFKILRGEPKVGFESFVTSTLPKL